MQTDKTYNLFRNPWVKYITIIIFGLFFKFLIDVISSLMYRNYELIQPIRGYLGAIVITWVVIELILLVNKRINIRLSWNEHLTKRLVVQLFTTIIIALVLSEVLRWTFISLFSEVIYISLLDEMIIATLIVLSAIGLVFFQLMAFLLYRWRYSLAELERFRKENAEIRFETLRAQVNPHFLFNSLNTLSSLIYSNQEKAELFIRELSDVYRYILEKRDTDVVELEDELKFLRSYISLLELRFENNLSFDINIDEKYSRYNIIPISLQLLIENAVKHNIISKNKPLAIKIFTDSNDYIVVSNNLQKIKVEQYTSRMGLKNIKNRYSYITDRAVEINETNDEFTVRLPIINNDEDLNR